MERRGPVRLIVTKPDGSPVSLDAPLALGEGLGVRDRAMSHSYVKLDNAD